MHFLLNMRIFHCYVSLPEGNFSSWCVMIAFLGIRRCLEISLKFLTFIDRPKSMKAYEVGPMLVINGVITSISRVKSPQLPSYFRPFIGAPCHSINNDRLGAHLVPGTASFSTSLTKDGSGSPWTTRTWSACYGGPLGEQMSNEKQGAPGCLLGIYRGR